MPVVLTLYPVPAQTDGLLSGAAAVAAGPDGLFAVRLQGADVTLESLTQPMSGPTCAALAGDRLILGGSPYGVATSPLTLLAPFSPTPDATSSGWQAGWMDHTQQPVVALAPAPTADQSGVLLAATLGDGILRSANHGVSWEVCNTGLADFAMLTVAWAPPCPPDRWPMREVAFAGGEAGLYRSPAGGLAWRACEGVSGAVLAIAVSADFHSSGRVLAIASNGGEAEEDEGNTALWLSTDGGHSFDPVAQGPQGCQALAVLPTGFVAGAADGLWHSTDGMEWQHVEGSAGGALSLLPVEQGLLVGSASGVQVASERIASA